MLALTLVLAACAGDGEPTEEPDSTDETGTETDEGADEGADEDTDEDAAAGDGSGDLVIAIGADVVSLSTHGSNDVPSSNVGERSEERRGGKARRWRWCRRY